MNKDRSKGKAQDIEGRIERQAGEWTGNKKLQKEGAKKQVRGKAQNVIGKAKDFARDVDKDATRDLAEKDEAA